MTEHTIQRGVILTAVPLTAVGVARVNADNFPRPTETRQLPPLVLRYQTLRTQALLIVGLFVGLTVVAMPRYTRDGVSIRSALLTHDDLRDRFVVEESVIPAVESIEVPRPSPLEELMIREDLWSGIKKKVPVISKQRAAALLKSVAFAPSFLPRPGTEDFAKVKEKVLKVIRSHGKKGVNMEQLASAIVSESRKLSYDPLFVAAVIKSESGFNVIATSNVGAKGLMQIMPATGRYVANFKDFPGAARADLTDVGYNLRLGITYLKYLEDMYGGNRVLTLIAYNWGPGHVERTMKGEKRGVPRAVVNYALRILGDHSKWTHDISTRAFS